jgi:hypothetical protein
MKQLFVSHSTRDEGIVRAVCDALTRATLRQIQPWFSSDRSGTGGLRPGDSWFDAIIGRIRDSVSVVTVITPKSLHSHWVLYESGIGSALHGSVVVLTYGIESMNELPGPLAHWQAYRIDSMDSFRQFCEKLFASHDIIFDSDMFALAYKSLTDTLSTLQKVEEPEPKKVAADATLVDTAEEQLLKHFDRRFFELTHALSLRSEYITYEISFTNLNGVATPINIRDSTTLQDAMDDMYFASDGTVAAYTYLTEWVLVNSQTQKRLIVREITQHIPANAVFPPGSSWHAERLERPYRGEDSSPEHARS